MIFKQYYLQSLSHASYLVGDEDSHIAAIVDPQRDVDHYLTDLDWIFTLAPMQRPIMLFIPYDITLK
jgi:hypothetical protein